MRRFGAKWRITLIRDGTIPLLVLGITLGVAIFVSLSKAGDSEAARRLWPDGSSSQQRVLVLIADAECPVSEVAALRRELKALRTHYSRGAEGHDRVRLIGVSISPDASSGISFLRSVGDFDELSSGGGWEGSAAQRFVGRELAGTAMVPQILVLDRRIVRNGGSVDVDDSLVVRLMGLSSIEAWTKRVAQNEGAPGRPSLRSSP